MAYEQIIYEVADNIATITLNRPEKLNAFTGIMMNEMVDAFFFGFDVAVEHRCVGAQACFVGFARKS